MNLRTALLSAGLLLLGLGGGVFFQRILQVPMAPTADSTITVSSGSLYVENMGCSSGNSIDCTNGNKSCSTPLPTGSKMSVWMKSAGGYSNSPKDLKPVWKLDISPHNVQIAPSSGSVTFVTTDPTTGNPYNWVDHPDPKKKKHSNDSNAIAKVTLTGWTLNGIDQNPTDLCSSLDTCKDLHICLGPRCPHP